MVAADWDEVAQLIHQSLNVWYEKNRGFKLVLGSWETMRVFTNHSIQTVVFSSKK
jgi:hypothetical protein